MIFVTGGTGLLGSHLLYRLATEGKSIRAIYRNKQRIDKVRKIFNFYDAPNAEKLFKQIEWVECDVLDILSLTDTMKGCSFIYHCAAVVSYNKDDFFTMMKINREGTANIVNIALEQEVEKLCFVSSTSAVALNEDNRKAPLIEANKWVQSTETSGYAISKYSSEKEIWRGIEEGLNAIIINPSVILGPGNWEESSLTIFKLVSKGFKFYTTGSNAFVDVRDVVKSMTLLMDSEIKNERFLCTGTNVSFKDLFDLIAKRLNVPPPSIKATEGLSKLAQAMDWFKGLFTGKRILTGETVRTSMSNTTYDSSKLLAVIHIQFTPLNDTIDNAVKGRIS